MRETGGKHGRIPGAERTRRWRAHAHWPSPQAWCYVCARARRKADHTWAEGCPVAKT